MLKPSRPLRHAGSSPVSSTKINDVQKEVVFLTVCKTVPSGIQFDSGERLHYLCHSFMNWRR